MSMLLPSALHASFTLTALFTTAPTTGRIKVATRFPHSNPAHPSSSESSYAAVNLPSPNHSESLPKQQADIPTDSTSEKIGNPVWKRPGQHCLWKIHFRYAPPPTELPQPSDSKFERVQQVTLTQHGKEYLQEVQMEDGKQWEYWSLNGAELDGAGSEDSLSLRPARNRHARRATDTSKGDPNANDLAEQESNSSKAKNAGLEDYHSLDAMRWIRPEHYKATLEIDGQQMLVFILPSKTLTKGEQRSKTQYYRSPLGGLPMRPGVTAAAIHAGSKLPAFLQKDLEWRVYEFTSLRNERLVYPRRVTRFLEQLAPAFKSSPKPLP